MPILSKFLYKSKITEQFMYYSLQLAKSLFEFYRKELKATEEGTTIMPFP